MLRAEREHALLRLGAELEDAHLAGLLPEVSDEGAERDVPVDPDVEVHGLGLAPVGHAQQARLDALLELPGVQDRGWWPHLLGRVDALRHSCCGSDKGATLSCGRYCSC